MHFFIDYTELKEQDEEFSYGPNINNPITLFNISSRFKLKADARAYAPSDGFVIIQPNESDPLELVNIILKPKSVLEINFTPVKYFVFRGLKKEGFFETDSGNLIVKTEDSSNNDLIANFWIAYEDRKVSSNNSSLPIPGVGALGYSDFSDPSNIFIDSVFGNSETLKHFEVSEADWIGEFVYDENTALTSFEVVLEEGDFVPQLDYARKSNYTIDVNSLSVFDKKTKREEILNFIDPTAFFGLFYLKGLEYKTESTPQSNTKKEDELYEDILSLFSNKNSTYLDIRNEIGYSLNFYENYDSDAIKLGDNIASSQPKMYQTDEWPIVIIKGGLNITAIRNTVKLSIRIDDNIKPLIYIVHATQDTSIRKKRFLDDKRLLPGTSGYTKEMILDIPNYHDTGSGERLYVPWYIKLHYCRQFDSSSSIDDKVLKTEKYTDNIFGPVNMNFLGIVDHSTKMLFNQDVKYVNGTLPSSSDEFGFIAERGVSFNGTNRVVFFASTLYAHKTTGPITRLQPSTLDPRITEEFTIGNSFFDLSLFRQDLRFDFKTVNDGSDQIKIPFMSPDPATQKQTENLLMLFITKSDLENLQNAFSAGGFRINHHSYITLVNETHNAAEGFYKYELHVNGLDNNDDEFKVIPSSPIIYVYTRDGLVFTSKAFSDSIPEFKIGRNFEERQGLNKNDKSDPDHDILSSSAQDNTFTVSGVEAFYLIPIGRTILISNSADIQNNGDYTVKNVEKTSGNNTIIEVEQSIVSTAGSGGKVYQRENASKPLEVTNEDHFISKDQSGIIGATNKEMRQLVNEFTLGVRDTPDDSNVKVNLSNLINQYAPEIFERACAYVQKLDTNNDYEHPDDRPLYWARIQMQVALQAHPFLVNSTFDRKELLILFEELSRGYTSVDFSSAPAGAIKLLVTGFDPFSLDRNQFQSNPSGPCTLNLHGKTLNSGTKQVFIQSMIVPVRYQDFDDGLVEKYIAPLIGGGVGKADMIITISQSGIGNFNIDRFATINRGGGEDNMNETRIENSDSVQLSSEDFKKWKHLETTLPKAMAQLDGDSNDPSPNPWGHTTVYAQHFVPKKDPLSGEIPELPNYKLEWDDTAEYFLFKNPSLALIHNKESFTSNIQMRKGSGGNYLSNEIFYRVSLAREKWMKENQISTKFPSGHFHVAWIQIDTDLDDEYIAYEYFDFFNSKGNTMVNWSNPKKSNRTIMDELKRMLNTVEDRIKRGIETYNDENDLF